MIFHNNQDLIMIEKKIAILGLGYVGLPLAVQLSFSYKVIGISIITELKN